MRMLVVPPGYCPVVKIDSLPDTCASGTHTSPSAGRSKPPFLLPTPPLVTSLLGLRRCAHADGWDQSARLDAIVSCQFRLCGRTGSLVTLCGAGWDGDDRGQLARWARDELADDGMGLLLVHG